MLSVKKITEHQPATTDLRAGLNLIRLTSLACKEFRRQSPRERRKLLGLLVRTATWKNSQLQVTIQEPFRTLQLSNSANTTKDGAKGGSDPQLEDWLAGEDSNLHSRLQRPVSCHWTTGQHRIFLR